MCVTGVPLCPRCRQPIRKEGGRIAEFVVPSCHTTHIYRMSGLRGPAATVREPTSMPQSLLLTAWMPAQLSTPQSRALTSKSMPGAKDR